LTAIENVDAALVVFLFDDEGTVGISARSLGAVNVQVIMEKLGGGGHLTMAAAQFKEITIEQAKDKLLEVLKDFQ
jgi:c-di-AMP phosphodiesterase-like protein